MNLLAIDASASFLSLALDTGNSVYQFNADADMKHSELILTCIDNLVREAGLAPGDIGGVICTAGPGSFTGLRIGFSAAKGLALGLNIPFAAVPTLDCIALPFSELTMPVIQARKNSFFYALFHGGRLQADTEASSGEIAQVITEKIRLAGPGAQALYESLAIEKQKILTAVFDKHGYAKELLEIAKTKKIFENNVTEWYFMGPDYCWKTDAEISFQEKV